MRGFVAMAAGWLCSVSLAMMIAAIMVRSSVSDLRKANQVASTSAASRPDRNYLTHDGRSVNVFDDLIKDKVVLINFIFTSCQASCPLETARLRRVHEALASRMGKDIFFYSISIDPKTDTPEVLHAYRERFKLGPGWTFLTGSKETIDNLQKKLGLFLDEVDSKKPLDHSLNLIVGNQKTGQWIKRSHLENPQVLATVLQQLHQRQPQALALKAYDHAPVSVKVVSKGEQLFYSRCVDCHTIGHGDSIGPDLHEVSKRRDPSWLRRWLKEPDRMLDEQDPIASMLFARYNKIAMPNLKLSNVDIDALLEFMSSESQNVSKGEDKL
jgi:protein SCO1/2